MNTMYVVLNPVDLHRMHAMVLGNTGHMGPHLCCIGSLIDVTRFVRRAEIAVGQARVPVERILLLFARESGVESHNIEKSQDRWFRITGKPESMISAGAELVRGREATVNEADAFQETKHYQICSPPSRS
jgi:hypothetical protein